MMRFALTVLYCSVCFLGSVHADERLLYTPLTTEEEADARSINDYFIKMRTLFAKRHRLVKVDMDALENAETLIIPLFDGQRVKATRTNVKRNEAGGYLIWEGDIGAPSIALGTITEQVGNEQAARVLLKSLSAISIHQSFYELEPKSGALLEPEFSMEEFVAQGSAISKKLVYSSRADNPKFVRGASILWIEPESKKEIRLQTLGMGGPYHILVEIDESKFSNVITDTGRSNILTPEQKRQRAATATERKQKAAKLRAQREIDAFGEPIGENPHDKIHAEMNAAQDQHD